MFLYKVKARIMLIRYQCNVLFKNVLAIYYYSNQKNNHCQLKQGFLAYYWRKTVKNSFLMKFK